MKRESEHDFNETKAVCYGVDYENVIYLMKGQRIKFCSTCRIRRTAKHIRDNTIDAKIQKVSQITDSKVRG